MKNISGGQLFYSTNNLNLFLLDQWKHGNPKRFDASLRGTLTLGDFMTVLSEHPSYPGILWRYNIFPNVEDNKCAECQSTNRIHCRLFLKPVDDAQGRSTIMLDKIQNQISGSDDTEKAIDQCKILQFILNLAETPAEKKFLKLYFSYVINITKGIHANYARENHEKRIIDTIKECMTHRDGPAYFALDCIGHIADIPTLIPQVYLNWQVGESGMIDNLFYKDNISRVDFIMLNKGNKHIIEINGLSHYKDESAYTRNLQIDRKLKKMGWAIHRFSNQEINEATNFDFAADELNLSSSSLFI